MQQDIENTNPQRQKCSKCKRLMQQFKHTPKPVCVDCQDKAQKIRQMINREKYAHTKRTKQLS